MSKKTGGVGIFGMLAAVGVGLITGYGITKLLQQDEKKESSGNQEKQEEKEKAVTQSNNSTFSSTTQSHTPESIFCPISQEIMKDPVITKHGISYDRSSILSWLEKSKTCPISRKPMTKEDLFPNYTLKSIIDEYVSLNSTGTN